MILSRSFPRIAVIISSQALNPAHETRRLSNYAVGFNLISMPTASIVMSVVVIMFGVMGVRMFDIRLGVEPVLDVSRLAFWAI